MMNIYDFDKTIYDGDSSVDFFKHCLKKNKKCLLILPKFFIYIFLYLIKVVNKEKLKSAYFSFIKYFDNVNDQVYEFWEKNDYKIKKIFIKKVRKGDIIVSASPEFLLKPISKKYNIILVATNVDISNGKITGDNCYGIKKISALKKLNVLECNEFYSDSLSDLPLAKISKKPFIVSGNLIVPWDEHREKTIKKIKKLFISPDFFTFCFIGLINVVNGIFIAYFYSLIIKSPIIAYMFGFFTSLMIAYTLNSILNFKTKMELKKFVNFFIDNIPNFLIQITSVIFLINKLKITKLLSYTISAVIAVPITFLFIKMHTFKNTGGEE